MQLQRVIIEGEMLKTDRYLDVTAHHCDATRPGISEDQHGF